MVEAVLIVLAVAGGVMTGIGLSRCFMWPGRLEWAVDRYGKKFRVFAKGVGGMNVAIYEGFSCDSTSSVDWSWRQVLVQFPSHFEEAKTRIEEEKARKESGFDA